MTTIRVESDEHWRELRARHVGGSEVAALFGEHPQLTRWELWQQKVGHLPVADLSENDRVFWGDVLEPAIADGVTRKTGWSVRKVRRYFSCLPRLGLGASLDYEIVAHDRGPGVLEIKTADWLVARTWREDGPPLAYELQLQAYMAATGRGWGVIAVLVGGNDLRLIEYERRAPTVGAIEREVAAFWQSIAEGREPRPDFERDGEALAKLHAGVAAGKIVDLSQSNRFPDLCAEYQRASAAEKGGEAARKAARAEMLTLIGDAEKVLCGPWRLSAGAVAAVPDRTVTPEMVGEPIKGRAGYRNLRLTEQKEKTA